MPATITKTSTTKKAPSKKVGTPAKKSIVDKVNLQTSDKPKKAKFVAPPKPTTEPTSINRKDYGYTTPGGKFKFWQGYDAKFKKNLMNVSRTLPESDMSREARKILVDMNWSTNEREQAMVTLAKQKTERAVARVKAKAEKAKAKAKKDEATDTDTA